LFEAIKSGASGYLLKNLEKNQLFDYLNGLARGEAPLSRELSTRLLREFVHQVEVLNEYTANSQSNATSAPELTPRQHEILVLVVDGLTYKEIGAVLNLSENTIKYHMGEILHRLHLKNREQVIAYAHRCGLLRWVDALYPQLEKIMD
jgi:DNA-binding NarL/FixJ family response regulator